MILTAEQQNVVDFCVDRIKSRQIMTTFGGLAGTGKTTIVSFIVEKLRPMKIAFACYTGKAKGVIEKKLTDAGVLKPGDFVGTIHSLVYQPISKEERSVRNGKEHIETWAEFAKRGDMDLPYDVIIIDEASMVSREALDDLQDLGVPILAIGDHGQLPPVGSNFNLMKDPMMRLEKIHRQAEGNPIIQLSIQAREQGEIDMGWLEKDIGKTSDGTIVNRLYPNIEDWTILCATNKKRVRLNRFIREKKFTVEPEMPQIGERIICLKNNHGAQIFNGMVGIIKRIEIFQEHWYTVEVDMGTHTYYGQIFRWQFHHEKTCTDTMEQSGELHPDEFGDLFDYAYCLSVWKAQGSEWPNVVFYEEQNARRWLRENWNRMLYTAVTRAKERLVIIEC